ncbi:MAG: transcription antitermination factor NusB [Acidimicrobiales bacterium]
MLPGSRREARERAIGLLYEADMRSCGVGDLLAELPVAPDAYAGDLVRGVDERRSQLEAYIRRYLRADWPYERLPAIDRIVLLLATFELVERSDVPTGVILSEAVELAKRYSTEESGRFVNGLLASVADEVRPTTQA